MEIPVHPLTNNTAAAFAMLSKSQQFKMFPLQRISNPPLPGHVRVVCMSDTHSENPNFRFYIPPGDIFIHAGDFTRWGDRNEVIQFNQWMKCLPHTYKIVIAGNHEFTFDQNCMLNYVNGYGDHLNDMRNFLTDCIYLEDTFVQLFGLKIYGSPWQPEHGGGAFNLPRGQKLLDKWNLIPADTDILVTHGPPLGHGDRLASGGRAGCVELLTTVQNRVKPKFHVFGHIHEGYGTSTDGSTIFINASTCDRTYIPKNAPIVFDIPIKN